MVMCGGSSAASRGSYIICSWRSRSRSAPASSNMTTMPGFMPGRRAPRLGGGTLVKRRDDRECDVTEVGRRYGRVEQPSIDGVTWVRTMIAHHLRAREGPDRGTHDHVAGPMTILVHSRESHQRGAPVHGGT